MHPPQSAFPPSLLSSSLGPANLIGRTTYNLFLSGVPSWLTGTLAFQVYNHPPYIFENVGMSNGLFKHVNATDRLPHRNIGSMIKMRDQLLADAGKPVYAMLMENATSGQYLAAGTFNYTVPCPSNITSIW